MQQKRPADSRGVVRTWQPIEQRDFPQPCSRSKHREQRLFSVRPDCAESECAAQHGVQPIRLLPAPIQELALLKREQAGMADQIVLQLDGQTEEPRSGFEL
jgi:hypothetical protein